MQADRVRVQQLAGTSQVLSEHIPDLRIHVFHAGVIDPDIGAAGKAATSQDRANRTTGLHSIGGTGTNGFLSRDLAGTSAGSRQAGGIRIQ